jgi:hypothetical protein
MAAGEGMKEYLGDSVYVDFLDGYMICLTTENGMGPSNTIYLEPEVMQALIRYAESLKSTPAKCPKGCLGIDLGNGDHSGCKCNGPGCDCPNHPGAEPP